MNETIFCWSREKMKMPEFWRGILVTAAVVAFSACAAAQDLFPMICSASSSNATVQAGDAAAQVGDLVISCIQSIAYTSSVVALPTVNFTVTMAEPISSQILSTSGGNVSDIYLLIDDPGSAAAGTGPTPGFGNSATPIVCPYSASSTQGCRAYSNTFGAGGIPVMTSAPNPLGSPNPTPPAANIYQGVVSGNAVTFYGVPILPPGVNGGTRTYRITNIRVNASAGVSGPILGAITFAGVNVQQSLSLPLNQIPLAILQTSNLALGQGQSLPAPIAAAPGGIVYLLAQGVGSQFAQPVTATSFPLPTSLAGISVTLQNPNATPTSIQLPLLSVSPESTCSNPPSSGTCASYVVISAQLPLEFQSSQKPQPAYLSVSENGVPGSLVQVTAQSDAVHVLTYCIYGLCPAGPPAVTHADGNLVDTYSPAKPGEEVVMWAVGLGATTPAVPIGRATPQPAPVTQETFQLNFDFRSNALPYRPVCATRTACLEGEPVFSGLAPGYAGLYQVNFIVPPPPAGTPPCDGSIITSNLTVSLLGSGSFDGARICVDPTRAGSSSPAAHRTDFRPLVTPRTLNFPQGNHQPSGGASGPF